jgi:hypothetical protein
MQAEFECPVDEVTEKQSIGNKRQSSKMLIPKKSKIEVEQIPKKSKNEITEDIS